MPDVIALDIGGVCLKLHPEKTFAALGLTETTPLPVEFTALTDMLERGMITGNEWLIVFRHLTGNKFSGKELRSAWGMIIGEAIEGMPELARELVEAGYKLVFFSDTSEIHMQEVYRKLPFANLVTGCILSYEVGHKKPDRKMYAAFEKEYGKPVFYVDDHSANVESGERCGWNSHHFTTAENMRKTLEEMNILGN
ncbi:MAG: HAD family hydrolase [Victivallales bacterium]